MNRVLHSKKSGKSRQFFLVTFGCQMNVYDSNLIASMLEEKGLQQTDRAEKADIILVNTCSVRGGAEQRAYARIASLGHYKKRNPKLVFAVLGCMAQYHGQRIREKLKHVDFVIGPDSYRKLGKILATEGKVPNRIITRQTTEENYSGIMAKPDSAVSIHIAVMRGCNKHCAYCVVPIVRGREHSRNPSEIEAEIQSAISCGIREVTLLGQTVNSYRHGRTNFADLLKRLNDIEGLARIRFTSPHPRHCTKAFISAMGQCEKVCRHIHLPVQSGSDKVLRKMRRLYSRARYLDIVRQLRETIPGIAITTDIITGFVGETQGDYEETLSLVRTVRFDSAFMFSYSPREGTEAFMEPETLTEQEKSRRLANLIEIQNRITSQKAAELVGRTEEVLMEGPSRQKKTEWMGKTSCFKKVIVPLQKNFRPGTLVKVRLTEKRGNTLAGIPVK